MSRHKYRGLTSSTWRSEALQVLRRRKKKKLSLDAIYRLIEIRPRNCRPFFLFSLHAWAALYENMHGLRRNRNSIMCFCVEGPSYYNQSRLTLSSGSTQAGWWLYTCMFSILTRVASVRLGAAHEMEHGHRKDKVHPTQMPTAGRWVWSLAGTACGYCLKHVPISLKSFIFGLVVNDILLVVREHVVSTLWWRQENRTHKGVSRVS